MKTMTRCWAIFAENLKQKKEEKLKVIRLGNHFRKYQKYHLFRKFALKAKWEA